ncbi:MAG: hypothetical protein A2Y38_15470 [Spirochaetes bacterium GWB1_59_5]|nr:MAG: hypothetical protein A2Y38_15470 [Spirochaetes bacterium GWB1_59_5]
MTNKEWMQQRRSESYPWMTDDQFECWCMFCDLMGGEHHVFGKVKPATDRGISIAELSCGGWSTFDFDRLTSAVVMAHDRCIRFSVSPCNMQYLRFQLHKRHEREGQMSARHPTLEEHTATLRKGKWFTERE